MPLAATHELPLLPSTPPAKTDLQAMLRASVWAATLEAGELERVVGESRERLLPVGGHAACCGESADCWFGVIEGLLKMSVSLPDGRHSTFTGVTAGGWAGEGTLLKGGRWRYDAIAVRETRLACVPRATFDRLVSSSLPFNRFLLSQLNARLSLFIGLMEFDRLFGPDARVARCLASLFDPDLYPSAGPFVALSQEEIGLLAGVSRQRANTSLHQLESAGLLKIAFGGVLVLDLAGLRSYTGAPTQPFTPSGHTPPLPAAPTA